MEVKSWEQEGWVKTVTDGKVYHRYEPCCSKNETVEEPTPFWLWGLIFFGSGVAITLVHVVIYGS